MIQTIRALSAPLLSLILLITGSGLFSTFLSIRMETEGFKTETIGIVVSSLYVGILLGSFRLDRWITKVGYVHSFVVFAIVSTLLTLAQAIWINPVYWGILRFLCGICMAGVFIVIESWLLVQSPPAMRGSVLSLYLALFYAALSAGQFLIHLSNINTNSPFYISAIFFALSTLPILSQKIISPKIQGSIRLQMLELFRISPLGFLGSAISGMLLAVIYGLVPVYAQQIGMEVSQISSFMGVIIFGGFIFQLPLGHWADRSDRCMVLNLSAIMTILLSVAIAVTSYQSIWLLFLLGWFFGGFSFTIYPLSMAYACDKLANNQIVSMTGGLVLAYGIGAVSGPLLAPFMMSIFGSQGLFYFLALIALCLSIFGMRQIYRT